MSTATLGIDPGSTKSAWVCLNRHGTILHAGYRPNDEVRYSFLNVGVYEVDVAVEYMKPRGMPTSKDEMDTMFELGRLTADVPRYKIIKVFRSDVKAHLCGSQRATDANIRQAIIDLYGGKDKAIGGVRCKACHGKGWRGRGRPPCDACGGTGWRHRPGPLWGITGDQWSALAVALTARTRTQ